MSTSRRTGEKFLYSESHYESRPPGDPPVRTEITIELSEQQLDRVVIRIRARVGSRMLETILTRDKSIDEYKLEIMALQELVRLLSEELANHLKKSGDR